MSTETVELILPTAFGLEAVVARELTALGYAETATENGRISVRGPLSGICALNLRLRSAERVLWRIGEFDARDFGELFDRTHALNWERMLPVDAAFPVRAKSVRSRLSHTPSVQSIVKKAVVEALHRKYRRKRFDESGPTFAIDVSLLKDRVTLCIDTTGPGLHKRGYRSWIGPAPLKETLAAGLVQLSYWNAERPFWDPVCGTGTIAIEAAMIARNMPPGMNRSFPSENWPLLVDAWTRARDAARDAIRPDLPELLMATDVDDRSIRAARRHAQQAGVDADIHFQRLPVAEVSSPRRFGCAICNPPYGERTGPGTEVEQLYREMRNTFERLKDWSYFVLTSRADLERLLGRKADRKRKLYNGRIECAYYQIHGPRPHDRTQRFRESGDSNGED
ncbi:MAG: class I SAM-dependent RNA methyltransferase [Planctomycetaceae bacterium]